MGSRVSIRKPSAWRGWPWAKLTGLALGCAWAAGCAGQDLRPSGPEVDSIEIEGNRELSSGELKAKILTVESGFWPFGQPSYFDPNAWRADLRRIERHYQARGYYQAKVLEDQVEDRGEDGVALRVRVREGLPTTVAQLRIRGLESLPAHHQSSALKDLPLDRGAVFTEEDWARLKSAIQTNLREMGYANAEVSGEAQVELSARKAEVAVDVRPGMRFRFGKVFVAADERPQVSARRIIEQAEGAVKPGAWYAESALAEAQARVFKMGVFGAVKVNRAAPDEQSGTVPVVVDVREAPFRTLKAGGGGGLDQTHYEARGLTEYIDRNFFGGLRRLTLRGRVGYAWLTEPSSTDAHGVVFNASAEFEQPRFLWRDLRLHTSVSAERRLEAAYNYVGGKLKAGVIWQPHSDFSIYPSYNFEAYALRGRVDPTSASPNEVLGCAQATNIGDQVSCFLPLSYLEQVIEWDRRDDKSEPRRGYYVALSLQEGGGPLGGAFRYLRIQPDLRYYIPATERLTLSMRLRVGTLLAQDNDGDAETPRGPIVSRFFSGGSAMRGFGNQRFSPMDELRTPPESLRPGDAGHQAVPIGGNGLLESSFEARYRLTDNLVLALFFDAGLISAAPFQPLVASYYSTNMLYAVGIGLRYLTLVGPIRVDVAYRLPIGKPLPGFRDRIGDVAYPGCIGFGHSNPAGAGAPEGPCAFHLSIGEAF